MSLLDLFDQSSVDAGMVPARGESTNMFDVVKAEFTSAKENYNSTSEVSLRKKFRKERDDEFKKDTGQDINTLAMDHLTSQDSVMKRPGGRASITVDELRDARSAILSDFGKTNGKEYKTDAEVEKQMQDQAQGSFKKAQQVKMGASGFDAISGSLIGGLGAGAVDPVNLMTMPFGAATSMGLIKTVLMEAGINMATEATLQPQILEWQKKVGNKYGFREAAENLAMAGLFGGGMGALGKGFRSGVEFFGDMSRNFERMNEFEAAEGAKFKEREAGVIESDVSRLNDDVDYKSHSNDTRKVNDAFREGEVIPHDEMVITERQIKDMNLDKNTAPDMESTIKKFTEEPKESPVQTARALEKHNATDDVFPQESKAPDIERQKEIETFNDSPENIAREKADYDAAFSEEADTKIYGNESGEDLSYRQLNDEMAKDVEFQNTIGTCGIGS